MLPTGQGGGASHQRGAAFPTPVGRLYGFPTGESPVVKVLYKTGAFYQLKGAVPPQRSGASYLPRAEALNPPVRRSRSQAEPLAPRAVRPGGAINPRGEAASTLGITASRRIPHKSPSSTNVAHSKKALTITVSAFFLISSFLSSRAASSQVLSAFVSLTTVFGMGTGVSSQLSPLNL